MELLNAIRAGLSQIDVDCQATWADIADSCTAVCKPSPPKQLSLATTSYIECEVETLVKEEGIAGSYSDCDRAFEKKAYRKTRGNAPPESQILTIDCFFIHHTNTASHTHYFRPS